MRAPRSSSGSHPPGELASRPQEPLPHTEPLHTFLEAKARSTKNLEMSPRRFLPSCNVTVDVLCNVTWPMKRYNSSGDFGEQCRATWMSSNSATR